MKNYDVKVINKGTAEKPYFKIYENPVNTKFLQEAAEMIMKNPPFQANTEVSK